MPHAESESGAHATLAGYRDGILEAPTPRGSDIRGSRGVIMQPAPRREGVRARGAGPPGGSWAALTLLKFIQAAGAAEGAHGGRLPAAASLHPRGGRPPTSRALHDSGPPGARADARTARWAAWRRRRALVGPNAALPQCTTGARPPPGARARAR